MWTSNVLRVRKCSSAAAWRNTRRYSSQTSLPITVEEFDKALDGLQGIGRLSRGYGKNGKPWKLGFAISGGVDSMALASLFANSRDSFKLTNLLAHAFIVDHKARPESTEEAEWVAEQCRAKFDMQASVLPLTWPADFDPLDHKRFETDARTLRYQALGRACRAAGIHNLFVAHHADDQAETVLMRLANNRLRSGLQAMQPVEWIPECSGIHGVSHSGNWISSTSALPFHLPFPLESGGVRILRPLLSFDKSRLIATCEQHGVAWAEDKTNHLQTYTSRNAIRHILKNHRLPAALSVESLVDVSIHMQKRVNEHRSQAFRLLRNCHQTLDIQTGSLLIQFPPFQRLLDGGPTATFLPLELRTPFRPRGHRVDKPIENLTPSDWNEAKNTAVCLLAQAGQLISPRETPPLGELASTVANIWPEFREFAETNPSQAEFAGNRTSYCVHSIWWRKWNKPPSFHMMTPSPSRKTTSSESFSDRYWLLTRQPLESHRPGVTPKSIRYLPSHVLPLTQVLPSAPASRQNTDYQLFDGRWWVSIRNYTPDVLILRYFTREDLARMVPLQIARQRQGSPERFIAVALSMLKPADMRFTLPALFRRDIATKKEFLIGFPTLNVSMGQLGYPDGVCSWRVRYKKLELGPSRQFDTMLRLVPGITHEMIENELAKLDKTPKRTVGKKNGLNPLQNTTAWKRRPPVSCASPEDELDKNRAEARLHGSKTETASKEKTVPLVPTAESKRRGRSEKRSGGGYNIKWGDFNDRFS